MTDNIELSGSIRGSSSASATMRVGQRDYYSTHLLFAAHQSATLAERREAELAGARPHFDPQHRGWVINSIVTASAFLEAAINEVLQDAADDHITPKIENLTAEVRAKWSAFWLGLDSGRRGTVLEKYQAALGLADRRQLKKGMEPYQSVNLLLQARNELLHFKPETRWSDRDPNRLVRGLAERVPRNPQVAGDSPPTSQEDLLSAGCARWAVEASVRFTNEFSARTETRLNYQKVLPTFIAETDLPPLLELQEQ